MRCDSRAPTCRMQSPVLAGGCIAAGVAAAIALVLRSGPASDIAAPLILAAAAPELAYRDLREQRLPNGSLARAYGAALLAVSVDAAVRHDITLLARAMVMSAALFVCAAIIVATTDGLGGGDAKLLGLTGLVLGADTWTAPLQGLLVGLLPATAFVGIRTVVSAICDWPRRASIPLAPFLLAGALVIASTAPS